MRHPIHLASSEGKTRPVVVLTREGVRDQRLQWTVAPVTSRVRGLVSEVAVGPANGIDRASVVNCDNVQTLPRHAIGRRLGALDAEQDRALAVAILEAFDLDA